MEPLHSEELREAASRMARQLVQIVEPVLYGWELKDAQEEFLEIVLAGLKELCDGAPDGQGKPAVDHSNPKDVTYGNI